MADDVTPTKGRDWGWKPYVFLILILALLYLPFPNRHPQFDGIAYYVDAQTNWQSRIALPANHVLPEPFFLVMNSIHRTFGIKYNLAGFFSLCDSLLMIGALLIMFGFYKRILGETKTAFFTVLALGCCFATWYFATDIENVALVVMGAALLFSIGWRRTHADRIGRGILLGLLAVAAALCMQTLAVLAVFTAVYFWRQKKRRLAVSFLGSFILVLFLLYALIAFVYMGVTSVEQFKNYVLGYAEISHAQSQGWMNISLMTPFAAIVGFSRSFLGLHPLMNLPWLKEMALKGLPGNVIGNQIAMAEGIAPWLQMPLYISTFILLLALPFVLWCAWCGRKQKKDDMENGTNAGLLLIYAIVMAVLTTIWLPQGGEFWLAVIVILLPLAMRKLMAVWREEWVILYCWLGLLAFTNLFGSIHPFADETVDPVLPSILYLDEIRKPDDIYLVPYSQAYPQRLIFHWVVPVISISSSQNPTNEPWEKVYRDSTGTIFFSSFLFNLQPQSLQHKMDPGYNLSSMDWERLLCSEKLVRNIGSMQIFTAQR
jgi:hypothetical protein